MSAGERVRQQYERYPYPHHPVSLSPEDGEVAVAATYTLAQYERERRLHVPDGKRALVAGCGTGYELHATAVFSPAFAEVIGVDFSEASLAVARQRLAHHGLARAMVQWGDLLEPASLPEGPFHYIGSHGVLHHLADPEAGLRNLAARLAPDGVMAVMLYDGAGRWPLYQARRALRLLGLEQEPLPEAVRVLKAMIKDAVPGCLFHLITHGELNEEYYAHDANLVDNFLHAQDRPFSVTELPGYLAQAGLELVGIADPQRWRLGQVMASACVPFYERVAKLKPIDQLAVIEGLNPFNNTEVIFWACHAGKATADWTFQRDSVAKERWQVNPVFARHARRGSELRGGVALTTAEWAPFFPAGKAAWPKQWQGQLLEGLWSTPKLGAELLAEAAVLGAPSEGEVLKWLGAWERDRVVLRV